MTDPAESLPVAAGIVSFHPDAALLLDLVAVLSRDVARIYLFNNAPLDPALEMVLADYPGLVAIDAGSNLGVGVGLNFIAVAASRDGFERLALFDQDSRPWPGMLTRLGQAFDRLEALRRAPAAIGPRLVPPSGQAVGASKAPRYRARRGQGVEGALVPVDFLPTSGTLFNLRTLRETGMFRADFFIDAIDLEWCFRAWAKGVSCWLAADVPMEHTVGSGTIPLGFGLTMPNQRPFRMGTYLRNTVYGFRLRHVPLGWKLKQLLYLPLQCLGFARHHGFSAAATAPMLRGLADGLRGRLGVPPGDRGVRAEDLAGLHPRLFHVAEDGAWPSIRAHGLLSTSTLLDLYEVAGEARDAIEARRRPTGVRLARDGLPGAVVRDQLPMSDAALTRCLDDGLAPADWYRILNGRVFFWPSSGRLARLLGARAYRGRAQTVLTLDTASLLDAHGSRAELSPINSGATIFSGPRRGRRTFLPLADYPFAHWRAKRGAADAVAEVTVPGRVPDAARHVIRVERVLEGVAETLWRRD